MAALFGLLKDKYSRSPLPPPSTFSDRTIIVTGSNTGLGLEAARHFVSLGAKTVVLAVRSEAKGLRAKSSIESSTKRYGVVQVWTLDYESYASVSAFLTRVETELPAVDIVVLNAGVFPRKYENSKEGWEMALQVNVLSTALLGYSLLAKLRGSKRPDSDNADPGGKELPHLCIVGSHVHASIKHLEQQNAPHILHALNTPEAFTRKQYGISKLFDQYITTELAAIITREGDDEIPAVVINSLSPGLVRSDLGRAYDKWYERAFVAVFFRIFAMSTEKGSRALVHASIQGRECHGKYWRRGKIAVYVYLTGYTSYQSDHFWSLHL